jgi:hypothetical protein
VGRTWAENDMFRLLLLNQPGFAGQYCKSCRRASPVIFGPRALRRTWGTRPASTFVCFYTRPVSIGSIAHLLGIQDGGKEQQTYGGEDHIVAAEKFDPQPWFRITYQDGGRRFDHAQQRWNEDGKEE